MLFAKHAYLDNMHAYYLLKIRILIRNLSSLVVSLGKPNWIIPLPASGIKELQLYLLSFGELASEQKKNLGTLNGVV